MHRRAMWSRALDWGGLLVTVGIALAGGAVAQDGSGPGAPSHSREGPAGTPPGPVADIVVHGVILAGEERSAFVSAPGLTEGRVRRVVPGTDLGPYRVSRIEANGVVLEKDGVSFRIPLGGPRVVSRPGAGGRVGGPRTSARGAGRSLALQSPQDRAALRRAADDLGVPVRVLAAQAARTGLGPADLLIAHRLARETSLGVEEVAAEFTQRGTWDAIMQRLHVDGDRLIREVEAVLGRPAGGAARTTPSP